MPSAKSKQKSRPPSAPSSNSINATADAVSTNRSSILLSSFAPQWTKLHCFASIIPGLKGQRLRVHDTIVGESIWSHDLDSSATVLQWGYLETHQNEPSKKRRKTDAVNGDERRQVVLAVGLANGDVEMYSPQEGTLLATLAGGHSGKAIRDFKFDGKGVRGAWSLGADARVVEWDLKSLKQLQSFDAPSARASFIHPSSSTSTIYIADHSIHVQSTTSTSAKPTVYPAFSESVNGLIPSLTQSDSQGFLVSAHTDRNIHVFNTSTGRLSGSLLARDAVSQIEYSLDPETLYRSTNEEMQILTALNSKGELEVFTSPFGFLSQSVDANASLKAQRKGMTKRSVACISLKLASSTTAILNSAISDDELILAWAEAGSVVHFERVQWRDGSKLSVSGEVAIQTNKKIVSADVGQVNGVKDLGKTYVDENTAMVGRGEEMDDEEEQDEEEDRMDVDEPSTNGHAVSTSTALVQQPQTRNANEEPESDADSTSEPTFGDRLRELHPSSILVSSAPLLPSKSKPSSSSALSQSTSTLTLTSLLTQALRSSDVSLLETVISQRSVPVITGTLSKLDPSLSLSLLQKITDRIASRPGRIGPLMTWTKHILIMHGGYIAARPDAVKRLRGLNAILKERSASLGLLLSLKGRLDMLDGMVTAHRTLVNKKKRGRKEGLSTGEEGEDERVLYVEGVDDHDSDESDEFVEESELNRERVVKAKTRTKMNLVNGNSERDVEVEFESDDDDDEDLDEDDEDGQGEAPKVNGSATFQLDDDEDESDAEEGSEGEGESDSASQSDLASSSDSEDEESDNGF